MSEEPVGIPRIKVRMESLSDIVFGLALSIGSLVLIGTSRRTRPNSAPTYSFSSSVSYWW
ncbi:MAG: hypothetical protein OK449_07720 [Thaumarchaeota archaeon]|nr:hypothetical protein [Nitrososphaerota archaeon]